MLFVGCSSKDEKLLKAENVVKNDYIKKRSDAVCSVVDSYWLNNVYIEVVISCNFIKKPQPSPFSLFLQFHRSDFSHYNMSLGSHALN